MVVSQRVNGMIEDVYEETEMIDHRIWLLKKS